MYNYGMTPLPSASGKNDYESNIFSVNFYGSKSATPAASSIPMETEETQPVLSFHVQNTHPKPNGEPNYVLVPGKSGTATECGEIMNATGKGLPAPLSPTQATNFKVICRVCSKSYKSKKRYENHLERCAVLVETKKLFNCYECRRQTNLKALLRHQQIHIHQAKSKSLLPQPGGNLSLPQHGNNLPLPQPEREPLQPTAHRSYENLGPVNQVQPPAVVEARKPSIFHSIEMLARSDRAR